ncbi:uncharacterized protein LOC113273176 [Papaver somniferum]|uniref:uncharacterized protein LOC113273176 n=1 Tax=Papaver somniferum TaxID=3469 RepID=UPI000E701607|nr:uncharacterized protein LOC113273176 [Papaver somniferum]
MINKSLDKEEREVLIALLRDCKDVFAFDYYERPGLDSELVAHTLGVSLEFKPVKQRSMEFPRATTLATRKRYQRTKAVRGKAISDLMAMFPGEGEDEVHGCLPGEVAVTDADKPWTMFFDGSSYGTVGGAGVVFESPQVELLSYSFKLDFPCSNNVTEYEALILGLRMAKELNLGSVEVKSDSKLVINQVNGDFYIKEPHLAPYGAEAQRLMNQTASTLDHTGRGGNKHVDALKTLASKVKLNSEEEGTVTIRRKELPNTWKEDLAFEEADY